MSRSILVALFVALTVAPVTATAQDQAREHDGGIFLRLSAGLGSTTSEIEYDTGDKVELSEGGGNHNFALGGVLTRNLALHATLFGWATRDPRIEVNGIEVGTADGTVTLNALGGGLTWYFGPNWYLSGSLAVAWLSFEDANVNLDTGTGGAMDVTIGKEWWVSDRWGLGVALGLQGYAVPADDANEFTGGSASIRFSATFN